MLKKVIRFIFTIIGILCGYILAGISLDMGLIKQINIFNESVDNVIFKFILSIIFGIIFYIIAPKIYHYVRRCIDYIENSIKKLSASGIIYGGFGALTSLIITSLIGLPLNRIDLYGLGSILFLLLNLIFAIIFANIFIEKI